MWSYFSRIALFRTEKCRALLVWVPPSPVLVVPASGRPIGTDARDAWRTRLRSLGRGPWWLRQVRRSFAAAGGVAVVPGDFSWDDVGDFASLAKLNTAGRSGDLGLARPEQVTL